jgi:3-hydroxyisobutyrate dehydrogenase-like beta-hydroxyacid dehydrogenase
VLPTVPFERLATRLHDRPQAKDLDLAVGFAARVNTPLFTSGIVRQMLAAASAAGYGREDFSSLGKIVREPGGV